MMYFINARNGDLFRGNEKPAGPWNEIDLDQYLCILEERAGARLELNPEYTPVSLIERDPNIGLSRHTYIEHSVSFEIQQVTFIGDWLRSQSELEPMLIPVILVEESAEFLE